jgi:hypothetical protein
MSKSDKRLGCDTCGHPWTRVYGPCTITRTIHGETRTMRVEHWWQYARTCPCDENTE